MQFPGSLRLSTTTFFQVFREVCDSLAHHGFEHLVAVNGHGGNIAALTVAVNHYFETTGRRVFLVQWWDLASDALAEIEGPMIHAEEAETSLAMALGQRVETDRATRDAWDPRRRREGGRPAVDVVRPLRDAGGRPRRGRADGHAPRHHRVGRCRRRHPRLGPRPERRSSKR
jgi:creatinine amidohydrolase/Fe(II)-dependent formamide hydrolase-like protein